MSKKILCVCDWGEVRSVALSNMIKDLNGIMSNGERLVVKRIHDYESIPIGVNGFSDESIKYFCDWVDKIICLSKSSQKKIEKLNYKPLLFGVGYDIWGNLEHYGLQSELKPLINMIREYEV